MAYYMATFNIGAYEITHAVVGLTPEETIVNARHLIDQVSEYADMTNDEIIEALCNEDIKEFDLVKIDADFEGYDLPIERATWLYDNKRTLIHLER